MAIRTITWTVDDMLQITPKAQQHAGVQGENNATEVVFKLPVLLQTGYTMYLEFIGAYGAYDKTEPLQVQDGAVRFLLPKAWTQEGGHATIRLMAINEQSDATPCSFAGRVRFDDRSAFGRVKSILDGGIQKLMDLAQAAVQTAATWAKKVERTAETVSADKEQTAAYSVQAYKAAVTAEAAAEAVAGAYKSAYDIAVDNGFEGTEEEWLASLKGEQGATTEEIDAAAAVAAAAAERADAAAEKANEAAGGVLTIEQNSGEPLRFWVGTQAEYDALEEKDATCFYLISDDKFAEEVTVVINDLLERVSAGEKLLEDHSTSISQNQNALKEQQDQVDLLWETDAIQSKDIGKLQSHDYIVEQGESVVGDDTWHYRKWNEGRVECWLRGSAKMAVTTECVNGGMYRTDLIRNVLPEGMFKTVDYANVTVIVWDTVGLPHTQIVQASADYGHVQWFMYRLSSTESSDFSYAIEINGCWK